MRQKLHYGLIILGFIFYSLITAKYPVYAAPAYTGLRDFTQPDGTVFKGRLMGDEKFNWAASEKGEALVKGEDGFWYYGEIVDGEFNNTAAKFAIDSKPSSAVDNKRVQDLAKSRQAIMEAADKAINGGYITQSSKASSSTAVLSGTTRDLAVITVDFNNISLSAYDYTWGNTIFGAYGSTVNNYYKEVSGGKFYFTPIEENSEIANDGVIRVKLNYNHPDTSLQTFQDSVKLGKDVLEAASAYFDLNKYDKDNNGIITTEELAIVMIFAGYEGSIVTSKSPSLWGHTLMGGTGMQVKNKIINSNFSLQGELHNGNLATIGIISHELGHVLGLPDLYDYDGSSDGVGISSIMASGSWTGYIPGDKPVHFDAYSMSALGFVKPFNVTTSGSFSLNSDKTNYNVLKVLTPNADEYFLVENRQFNGFDESLKKGIKSGGIAIWHIDNSIIRSYSYINNNELHKGVDLEEASEASIGYPHLDQADYFVRVFDDYFYVGGNNSFSDTSKPSSKLYNSSSSGVNITVLDEPGTVMSVVVSLGNNLAPIGVIENPGNGAEVSGIITFQGWVLNSAGVSNISVYIDNVFKGYAAYGTLRWDIWNMYKLYANKQSGYYYSLDTRTLADGIHTVKITQRDKNGGTFTLKEKSIVVKNNAADSLVWERAAFEADLNDIANNTNGIYVSVGQGGIIKRSADGQNWDMVNSGTIENLRAVEYGNGKFVVVGGKEILTSVDGENWNRINVNYNMDYLVSLAFGNGKFIAAGTDVNYAFVSTDGVNWHKQQFDNTTTAYTGYYTTYQNGNFFILDTYNQYIYKTQDAVSWSKIILPQGINMRKINSANGKIILIGDNGEIAVSDNGINWYGYQVNGSVNSIYFVNNKYISIGNEGQIFSTSDFINWTRINSGNSDYYYSATYHDGNFIIVGKNGAILKSTDLASWTKLRGIDLDFRNVVYGEPGGQGIYLTYAYETIYIK